MKSIRVAALLILVFAGAVAADEKRSFVDDAERRVEIPVRPKRIVVLNSSNLEILYAVGGKAVGRPESTGMPKTLYEKVEALPSVGETPSPNVERIASLSPDLVIGINVGFHHAIIPALERAGIPIILLSINSYSDIIEKIGFYGSLTGNTAKASRIISAIEKRVEGIRKAASGHTQRKVAIIWGSPQSFTMALPSSFVGNLVEMLGGINIAAGVQPTAAMPQYAPLSMEYVLSKDPDLLLLITHGNDDKVAEKFRKELESHPAWKGLRAIRDGRLYTLPYPLFGVNPAVRVTDAIDYLAAALHPEMKKGSGGAR